MITTQTDIYTTFDKIKSRHAKEIYLKQQAKVIWHTLWNKIEDFNAKRYFTG